MKGGSYSNNVGANIQQAYGPTSYSETVPFVPPGKGYVVGGVNGLEGGYYYNLSPDMHGLNGEIMNTSLHGNTGAIPVLRGGKRKALKNTKKNRKLNKKITIHFE